MERRETMERLERLDTLEHTFRGNIARICPDCSNHLINLAPNGERYHCSDCELRLIREDDRFRMVRFGESLGHVQVDEVDVKVTWRPLASAV